jgi:hypothetical protein
MLASSTEDHVYAPGQTKDYEIGIYWACSNELLEHRFVPKRKSYQHKGVHPEKQASNAP